MLTANLLPFLPSNVKVIKPQGNYGKLHKIHLELNLTYDK
jgi:hypothetical protein